RKAAPDDRAAVAPGPAGRGVSAGKPGEAEREIYGSRRTADGRPGLCQVARSTARDHARSQKAPRTRPRPGPRTGLGPAGISGRDRGAEGETAGAAAVREPP